MTKKMLDRITELLIEKKAEDIKIIKVINLTSLTDYFINCTSNSDPQTKAIKNHIQNTLSKEFSTKPIHIEGYENLRWVLMDYVDLVINIFHKEEREYYNIERLWADADIKSIKDLK